jgi:hypothetical protein
MSKIANIVTNLKVRLSLYIVTDDYLKEADNQIEVDHSNKQLVFRQLARWANTHLKTQFGFRQDIGSEEARHFVFKTLVRAQTNSELIWVCQIDLSNAYNTINLFHLNNLIIREKFWNTH